MHSRQSRVLLVKPSSKLSQFTYQGGFSSQTFCCKQSMKIRRLHLVKPCTISSHRTYQKYIQSNHITLSQCTYQDYNQSIHVQSLVNVRTKSTNDQNMYYLQSMYIPRVHLVKPYMNYFQSPYISRVHLLRPSTACSQCT